MIARSVMMFVAIGASVAIGQSVTPVTPYRCGAVSQTSYVCDGGSVVIGGLFNRLYTVVTNLGAADGGTNVVRCRADGFAPRLDAGSPGDVLSPGAYVAYTNRSDAGIRCACDTGWIGGSECAQ